LLERKIRTAEIVLGKQFGYGSDIEHDEQEDEGEEEEEEEDAEDED
jgi:hypothetical protein